MIMVMSGYSHVSGPPIEFTEGSAFERWLFFLAGTGMVIYGIYDMKKGRKD